MRRQGDHFTARRIPSSCKSTKANNQQVHARKRLVIECEWTFSDTMWTTVLQSSFENCFVFWYSSPLPLFFLFSHSLCLCMLLAADGDDGMGWIFNRFVSGSTMGGGIVVNIITYRSLRLHFPRPCQTGAITHSSQPHHHHTYTHIPTSWLAVTVPVYTVSLCPCLMTPLTLLVSCFFTI